MSDAVVKLTKPARAPAKPAVSESEGFQRCPLDWERIEEQPPQDRQWFAPGWLGPNQTALMAGPAGVGKSLCAQQLASEQALCMAGVLPVNAGRGLTVLGWFAEDDDDELARRQLRIAEHMQVSLPAFRNRFIAESLDGRDATLAERLGGLFTATPLMDELREQVHDYRADIVLLDNMARMFGGDENSRHEVTRFCAWLRGAVGKAALVLLSHPAKAAGSEFSGSTAWEAAVRSRWYLGRTLPDQQQTAAEQEAADGDTTRWLCRRKANYSARDYVRLEYRDGVFVADVPVASQGSGLMQSLRAGKARSVILDGFRALRAMGKVASDARNSANYLPRVLLQMRLAEGCTERELSDALNAAMVDGALIRGEVGKYPNRTPMMGLIEREVANV